MEDFNEILYDKIENYLRGRLPVEDATRFESEIKSDATLRELVNLHRLEYEEREQMIRQQLREQVKDWVKHQDPSTYNPKSKKWWRLLGGFFVLLFVIFIWFWYNPIHRQLQSEQEQITPNELLNDSIRAKEVSPDTNIKKPVPPEQNVQKRSYATLKIIQQKTLEYKKRDLDESSFRGSNTFQSVIAKYADLDTKSPDYEADRKSVV